MGVKKRLIHEVPENASELRERLVEEWRKAEDNNQEPIIIEERESAFQPIHLYVIWSDWGDLSLQDRSEIIMDAFERLRDTNDVLDVSVAMGLTPSEAERIGLRYS